MTAKFIRAMFVILFTFCGFLNLANADMVVGTTIEAAAPSGKVVPIKARPCNARCIKGKMEVISSIMARATTAPSGGLTRLTCKQVQERVNEVVATIPKDVVVRFDQTPDDFPCWGVYIGPRR